MHSRPLLRGITAAIACLVLAAPLRAQAPAPGDLPWGQPLLATRRAVERIGFGAATAQTDSSVVFTAVRGALHAELRTRFRNGVLWHAFYTARGDSSAVARDLDATAAALAARYGAPRVEGLDRVWMLPEGTRLALPPAPGRLEDGGFGYGIAYESS